MNYHSNNANKLQSISKGTGKNYWQPFRLSVELIKNALHCKPVKNDNQYTQSLKVYITDDYLHVLSISVMNSLEKVLFKYYFNAKYQLQCLYAHLYVH